MCVFFKGLRWRFVLAEMKPAVFVTSVGYLSAAVYCDLSSWLTDDHRDLQLTHQGGLETNCDFPGSY